MEIFIYLFAALFSVLNPIGTVPIFVGLTMDDDKKERSRISLWTAIDVFIILIISYFIGEYVLQFFGISLDALRIAGGLIIVSSGFSLLTGKFSKTRGINKKVENDIFELYNEAKNNMIKKNPFKYFSKKIVYLFKNDNSLTFK